MFSDAIDWIQNNIVNNTRTRRGILKKLKELYLLTDYKAHKKTSTSKVPREWQEQEILELTELFNDFKDAIGTHKCGYLFRSRN